LDNKNLLSNLIMGNNYNRGKNFINNIITNPLVLAKPVGLNIKIAGRLTKDRIVPKTTTKVITVGNLNLNKINFLEKTQFTAKNRRGTYTISIKMGHARVFSTSACSSTLR
jgi:hypothetical protein